MSRNLLLLGCFCFLLQFGCSRFDQGSMVSAQQPEDDRSTSANAVGISDEKNNVAELSTTNSSATTANQKYRSVRIDKVPHVQQRPDFCGEACVEMALRRLGKKVDQDAVFDHSGLSPTLGRGCYTKELTTAVRNLGFKVKQVGYGIEPAKARQQLEARWQTVHADLLRDVPTILCMHYNDQPNTTEHFRLIVGYDAKTDEVLYHEPAVANGAYRRMDRSMLLKLWPLKYQKTRWTVIQIPLELEKLKIAVKSQGHSDADFAQHIMRLKKKLPSDDFHFVIEKPFVVVGNDSAAMVKRRAAGTVRWAVTRLKKDYFSKDPTHIIDVWLFKDKPTYNKYTKEVFNDTPTTPFGYYTPTHRALIMNISTGGGTLVHEIVHPFIASNFPSCPAWFNEGLASLYEQSMSKNGKIWGATNWRLAGLQRAIAGRALPSFKTLCSTSRNEFYSGDDAATNYGQARYLCYYLQEKGKLRTFYHAFRKAAKTDPTGYKTLQTVLGENDMIAFQKKWEKYVSQLRYPR